MLGIDPFLHRSIRPEFSKVEFLDGKANDAENLLSFLTDERAALVDHDLKGELGITSNKTVDTAKGILHVKGSFPNPSGEPLVIMDIGLPGMSGIEAAQGIKAAVPETRVIVLAPAGSPLEREHRQAGIFYYAVEPFLDGEIVEFLQVAYLPPLQQEGNCIVSESWAEAFARAYTYAESNPESIPHPTPTPSPTPTPTPSPSPTPAPPGYCHISNKGSTDPNNREQINWVGQGNGHDNHTQCNWVGNTTNGHGQFDPLDLKITEEACRAAVAADFKSCP